MNEKNSILLMDSDAETLEQFQSLLRREGYTVSVAADGHAALRLVHMIKPDLIVSSLLLAGLDGYKVWKIIRADQETAHIPILVVSDLTVPVPNELWRPTPDTKWQIPLYDALLPKPVDLHRFVRVVKKLLEPEQAHTIPGGPSVIIAIEDKELQAELATILQNQDFGIETPHSLKDAQKLARILPPAAFMLDCRTVDPNVRAAAEQIKRFIPSVVIFLMVHPDFVDSEVQFCDSHVLRMPIHPTHTVAALNKILELNNMRERNQILSKQLISVSQNLFDTQETLRAQNEELQYINDQLHEIDNLKETLTGMVVHDLKGPLGAVLGALNFILFDPNLNLPEKNRNLVSGAVAAGSQMLRLIETLLEGQRLEAGRIQPDQEPIDLLEMIDGSLERISPLLTLHHLTIERETPGNLPLVFVDFQMSQRVLENLLDNAIKFSSREATIKIKVTFDNKFVTVSVEDQGPGIPKEHQSEIFNRFAQIKNVITSASRSGFGLGLTFCSLATEAMNGRIWVESDGKSGTKFIFTLPVYNEEIHGK